TLEQEQTERTEKTIPPFPLFPPVRIALVALALLALGTPRAEPGFRAPLSFDVGSGPVSNAVSVAVADFNGDGIPDLAVANGSPAPGTQGKVSILQGKGDGTFRTAVEYATGERSSSVAVGDFNGDGIPDLALSDNAVSNGTVSVLLG